MPPVDTDKIRKRIDQGLDNWRLSREFGLPRETIASIRRQHYALKQKKAHSAKWPKAKREMLRKLRNEGVPFSEISARFGPGYSRNACIGMAHRMGLAPNEMSIASPKTNSANTARKARAARKRGRAPSVSKAPKDPTRALPLPRNPTQGNSLREIFADTIPVVDDNSIPVEKRVPIVRWGPHGIEANEDLKPTTCRWPLGSPDHPDFGFCPERKESGLSYCASHARIAYRAPTPVARRAAETTTSEPVPQSETV
jgi:GcrA cell cycle regulator